MIPRTLRIHTLALLHQKHRKEALPLLEESGRSTRTQESAFLSRRGKKEQLVWRVFGKLSRKIIHTVAVFGAERKNLEVQ